MSPRNQDNANCKSTHYPVESDDSLNIDFTPNILHKKHKVIKLVKAQLLNLQEGGLRHGNSAAAGGEHILKKREDDKEFALDVSNDDSEVGRMAHLNAPPDHAESRTLSDRREWLLPLILFLTVVFIVLLMAAWLSAGPLSNRAPHTPISWSSLVKTDGICALEKKYLLRWSASNNLE